MKKLLEPSHRTVLFLFLCWIPIRAEDSINDGIFTSNSDLQHLLWTEAEVVRGLQQYIHEEELKIEKLKK